MSGLAAAASWNFTEEGMSAAATIQLSPLYKAIALVVAGRASRRTYLEAIGAIEMNQ